MVWGEQAKVAQQVLDQNPDQQQQNITYDITGFDPSFVDKFALTSDQLDLLSTGTALQGYNQNVLIYLLKKAENLDQLKSNNPYIYLLLDSSIRNIKSALKANNTNNLQKTNFFLNCAWETLEFTKAAVEGIVIGTAEGLMSPFTLAYDLYTNPESYVKACVKCILALGDLYNDDFIVDTDKVERDAKELRASIDAFVDEVGKKWDEADKYDVTRTIFQYGSEIPSSGMSFSLVGNLRKIMLTKGKILAKDVKKLFTKIGKKVVNSIKNPPSINTATEGFIAPNGVVKEVEKDVAKVVEGIVAKGEQIIEESIDSALVKPAGKGSSANGIGTRVIPETIEEQVAMKQVMSNPYPLEEGGAGEILDGITMNDKRWSWQEGWVKMEQKIAAFNKEGKKITIVIHYVYNKLLNQFDDFKFKFNWKRLRYENKMHS